MYGWYAWMIKIKYVKLFLLHAYSFHILMQQMGETFLPKHILDGSKFGIQEPRMKFELQVRKLWQIVNKNLFAPTDEKTLEVYNMKNELTTLMIFHEVLDEVLLMISSSTSAKEAWDRLNFF